MKKHIFAVMALLVAIGCAGQNKTKDTKDMKAIVIFFSHAGENYSVGNIEVGNTKIVADYISELTGADQFEIVAEKDYDMPYNKLIQVAKEESQ